MSFERIGLSLIEITFEMSLYIRLQREIIFVITERLRVVFLQDESYVGQIQGTMNPPSSS